MPKLDQWGVMCPAILPVESTRNLMMTAYPRMIEILQLLGSSSFLIQPSEKDFDGPLQADIEQYLATDNIAARDRVKLFRLAWDVAGSAFGSRQVLYERFFASDPLTRARAMAAIYPKDEVMQRVREFLGARRRMVRSVYLIRAEDSDDQATDVSRARQRLRAQRRALEGSGTRTCSGLHAYHYRPGCAAFMSADKEQSHEVALMQLGDDAPLQQKAAGRAQPHGVAARKPRRPEGVLQPHQGEGQPIDHIADHGISLGIYLRDPDGNGVEVFYEMPRAEWPVDYHVFSRDKVGRGRFPGPWDAEMVRPAPGAATCGR